MKIQEEYSVRPIPFSEAKEWCLYKHYAKRIPPISFAFGLFNAESVLQGICTYGHPLSCTLKGIFGEEFGEKLLELNRLCVNDGLPKNVLSFFVSQTFKMLPAPTPLVSYADSGQGHHGYIYQATNWIYTGLSAKFEDYVVRGMENLHPSTIGDRAGRSDKANKGRISHVQKLREIYGEENVYLKERSRKHRYFYFLGNKREVRRMKSLLPYKVQPYPKGDNTRYDASYSTTPNGILF